MQLKKIDIGIASYAKIHIDDIISDKENIKKIPLSMRRRLSDMDKAIFATIYQNLSLEDIADIDYILTVSQLGFVTNLVDILKSVNAKEEILPAQFSTSVHNFLAGAMCIALQKNIPSTAISADDTAQALLIELSSLYQSGYKRILAFGYDYPQKIGDNYYGEENNNIFIYTAPMEEAKYKITISDNKEGKKVVDDFSEAFKGDKVIKLSQLGEKACASIGSL